MAFNSEDEFWFTRSTYWGTGVWLVHESGRDLGRVSRCFNDESCCNGWHGWKAQYPASGGPEANKPDVTGAQSRHEAAERLHKIWEASHGPVSA